MLRRAGHPAGGDALERDDRPVAENGPCLLRQADFGCDRVKVDHVGTVAS
jgi:hypothetical protein